MKKMFSIAWRLAILVLPWQSRWFSSGIELAGWPWEQGRWSFYLSWVLIAATILLGWKLEGRKVAPKTKRDFFIALGGLFLCSIVALALNPEWQMRLPAIAEWWIQIVLLGMFVWTLWKTRVPFKSLAEMFVLSLVPHIALGFWQFAIQYVFPMKWLGIAAQDPRALGVSVVEAGEFRTLRIYGGFPHPNIFGGWLAIGTLVSTWLASCANAKRRATILSMVTALLSLALFLTFARSAWIAVVVGMAFFIFRLVRRPVVIEGPRKQFFLLTVISSVLLVGIIGFTQRHLFLARIQSAERIEVKSLDERKQSLVDGVNLVRAHLVFGTGPNGELIDLVRMKLPEGKTRLLQPAQPPHSVFLLLLVNFGIVGFLLFAYLARRLFTPTTRYWLLAPILILALFDHYLASLWAGQTLVTFALLFAISES